MLEHDFRNGGTWKIETTADEGQKIVFHGTFRDVTPRSGFIQTFGVEGMFEPGDERHTFREEGGKTHYRVTSYFPDMESRAGMLASGMESGANEGLARLIALLEDLKAEAKA